MTVRPGSRDYYYQKLELLFPGVKEKYFQAFGDSYQCSVLNWRELDKVFQVEIVRAKIRSKIPAFDPERKIEKSNQIPLFGE